MSTSQLFFLLESIDICYQLCDKEVANINYSDNHVCSVQTKYAHNLPNEVLHFQWETLEKEYSENYQSVHIEMIGTACIDGQLHHSSPYQR